MQESMTKSILDTLIENVQTCFVRFCSGQNKFYCALKNLCLVRYVPSL